MKTQFTRLAVTTLLGVLLIVPSGCRSKKTAEPKTVPIETRPVVSVPAPAEDFVVEESTEERIDWTDIDEMNRLANARGWLRDAFYAYDSSALNEEGRSALASSAAWLSENPRYALLVEGHCDERGTEQYNLALGERRAHVASEYMRSLGVSRDRIRTMSFGESRPFVDGASEQAHSQNRRAHLKISGMVN